VLSLGLSQVVLVFTKGRAFVEVQLIRVMPKTRRCGLWLRKKVEMVERKDGMMKYDMRKVDDELGQV
jgi:hypothetical protein